MGWGSGSQIMDEVITVMKKAVKDEKAREKIYDKLIDTFEDFDCDTLCECVGNDNAFDLVFNKKYPDND